MPCAFQQFSIPGFSVPILRSRFGGFYGPVVLDDLMCSGNEEDLMECSTGMGSHQCTDHTQDAGVICSHSSPCEENTLRLVVPNELTGEQLYMTEGELEEFNFIDDEIHRGRLEVCRGGGGWESVCYQESWGNGDATVACPQLGFSPFGKR